MIVFQGLKLLLTDEFSELNFSMREKGEFYAKHKSIEFLFSAQMGCQVSQTLRIHVFSI